MKNKVTKKGPSEGVKLAIAGASVAALAATAYFMLGPNGKKNRQHAKSWAVKMKGEIIEKLEIAGEITKPIYDKIVDSVAAEYAKTIKDGDSEVTEMAKDLKKHWKTLSSSTKSKS